MEGSRGIEDSGRGRGRDAKHDDLSPRCKRPTSVTPLWLISSECRKVQPLDLGTGPPAGSLAQFAPKGWNEKDIGIGPFRLTASSSSAASQSGITEHAETRSSPLIAIRMSSSARCMISDGTPFMAAQLHDIREEHHRERPPYHVPKLELLRPWRKLERLASDARHASPGNFTCTDTLSGPQLPKRHHWCGFPYAQSQERDLGRATQPQRSLCRVSLCLTGSAA